MTNFCQIRKRLAKSEGGSLEVASPGETTNASPKAVLPDDMPDSFRRLEFPLVVHDADLVFPAWSRVSRKTTPLESKLGVCLLIFLAVQPPVPLSSFRWEPTTFRDLRIYGRGMMFSFRDAAAPALMAQNSSLLRIQRKRSVKKVPSPRDARYW